MQPYSISAYTLTCAAGAGMAAIQDSINDSRTGLSNASWPGCDFPTWLGRVAELDDVPALAQRWDSRNNRLANLGLQNDGFIGHVEDSIHRFGTERCGIIIGTSTSSIGRTEEGFRSLNNDNRFEQEFIQMLFRNILGLDHLIHGHGHNNQDDATDEAGKYHFLQVTLDQQQ